MLRRKQVAPGDLVYLSERKLYRAAIDLGIKTGGLAPEIEVAGTLAAQVGAAPAGASVGASARGTRRDPAAEERSRVQLLEKVLKRIGALPTLERNEDVHEGELFRFHRFLRFGVGHSDAGPLIKALVVVDGQEVPPGFSRPGLLMNGSIVHVRDPYATDELRGAEGSRSGSGTERLFNWLEEVRRSWEADPDSDARSVLARLDVPPRGTTRAIDMYRLFAGEGWLGKYMAEPLMHGATCEGVARASFVAPGEELTVVMGSPLYIRCRPLPRPRRRIGVRQT